MIEESYCRDTLLAFAKCLINPFQIHSFEATNVITGVHQMRNAQVFDFLHDGECTSLDVMHYTPSQNMVRVSLLYNSKPCLMITTDPFSITYRPTPTSPITDCVVLDVDSFFETNSTERTTPKKARS